MNLQLHSHGNLSRNAVVSFLLLITPAWTFQLRRAAFSTARPGVEFSQWLTSSSPSQITNMHARSGVSCQSFSRQDVITKNSLINFARHQSTQLYYFSGDDMMIGEKYEMVRLPDSMIDTTIYVGNMCEFVTDEMLGAFFAKTSSLLSLPAVVVRKPDSSSRKFGFVTFPSVEEAEAAIIRYNGFTMEGKRIRVKPVRDDIPRVRVPEKFVAYTVGEKKTNRKGELNTLRRISSGKVRQGGQGKGQDRKKKNKQKKGSRSSVHQLNKDDMKSFLRAERNGYLTLEGTGFRRGRGASSLANAHRTWCDSHKKPQIVLCKASGGRRLDNVIVDLSPLCRSTIIPDSEIATEFLTKWKEQILAAAKRAGMVLERDYIEDNTLTLDICDDNDFEGKNKVTANEASFSFDTDSISWARTPISKLPVVSLGVFEGERSKAKAMSRELSTLWEIKNIGEADSFDYSSENEYRGGAAKKKKIPF